MIEGETVNIGNSKQMILARMSYLRYAQVNDRSKSTPVISLTTQFEDLRREITPLVNRPFLGISYDSTIPEPEYSSEYLSLVQNLSYLFSREDGRPALITNLNQIRSSLPPETLLSVLLPDGGIRIVKIADIKHDSLVYLNRDDETVKQLLGDKVNECLLPTDISAIKLPTYIRFDREQPLREGANNYIVKATITEENELHIPVGTSVALKIPRHTGNSLQNKMNQDEVDVLKQLEANSGYQWLPKDLSRPVKAYGSVNLQDLYIGILEWLDGKSVLDLVLEQAKKSFNIKKTLNLAIRVLGSYKPLIFTRYHGDLTDSTNSLGINWGNVLAIPIGDSYGIRLVDFSNSDNVTENIRTREHVEEDIISLATIAHSLIRAEGTDINIAPALVDFLRMKMIDDKEPIMELVSRIDKVVGQNAPFPERYQNAIGLVHLANGYLQREDIN